MELVGAATVSRSSPLASVTAKIHAGRRRSFGGRLAFRQ